MKIGITSFFQFSMFSGGGSSTVLSVAETLKLLGHTVTLINMNGKQEWWDDMHSLKDKYTRVNYVDLKETFDLIIEIGQNLPDRESRLRSAKHCVWLVRRPILLNDIENTIFPVNLGRRNLDGLSAIWPLDFEVSKVEHQYLETISRSPVIEVPFVWSPSIVDAYRKEVSMPSWIQIVVHFTQQIQKPLPWSIHVCETNNSASSSSTIPLVILNEIKRQGKVPLNRYKIHNAQQIEHSAFFKQNVLAHCQTEDLSGDFIGRQRVMDWTMDPMSCVLGHLRFRRIRPYLLDTTWCGIPLIHNSTLLRDLGCGYERYYYEDNSIVGGAQALQNLHEDINKGLGMFKTGAFAEYQKAMLATFGPSSARVKEGWSKALATISNLEVPPPIVYVPHKVPEKTPELVSNNISVLFTDMWDGFNPDYNMFLLMMQEGSKNFTPKPEISGYSVDTLPLGVKPNVIVFGPFGSMWKDEKWSGIPKAHFTGENTKMIDGPDIFLNMGFPHADFIDEKYIRLPLWMLEIDWFKCDPEKIQNPKPLPLEACLRPVQTERSKFCAFVVTNPRNPVRNNSFLWLSQYKKVDSAGRLFNNIGDEIFAGLGGGGGELKKFEFLKQYKFCLAYENESAQGYTTEKLLHAKVAGCVPIYWGDPKVERDFNTKGFIDARRFTSPEELIEAVKKIDENPELYNAMASVPALDDYKRDIVRRTLSQVSFMLLRASMPSRPVTVDMVPRFLGSDGSPNQSKSPIVVTMASQTFLPSLHQQLAGLKAQQESIPDLEAQVWFSKDVPEGSETTLKENFPFASFKRLPEDPVEGFPDYWASEHFGWKLWILKQVVSDSATKDRLVLYMDAGVFLSRWPKAWLSQVEKEGVCFLEDPRQTNEQWCHETFCRKMSVTEKEKKEQQLWAGCLSFVGGHEKALTIFNKAYELSKTREIIVGPKWSGIKDGKPFGHRHDQSILSILSSRHGLSRYPMDEIYCDHSLRKAFLSGKALYVHRGNFTIHREFTKGIDDAYVINLDRRPDRLEKLYTSNPELKGRLNRLSAVNGRQMKLTPAIARLFKPHDFFWKKAIMGCALSHLTLWWQLVNERPEIKNYLILEDDVKMNPEWETKWKEASGHVPDDADVVYLGGILPPNRQGFEALKERKNQYFSQVSPNKVFGQKEPSRYFHWCAYAYVLSRKGAEKILQILMAKGGYWTSADHMVCNVVDYMNLYFLDPLVAGCYQDDDPKYKDSAFNDFSRIDGFDSDLWNNDDRFTVEEIDACMNTSDINISKALEDAKTTQVVSKKEEPKSETVIGSETPSAKQVVDMLPPSEERLFYTLPQHKFSLATSCEKEWIQELLGKHPFSVHELSGDPPNKSIIIVQRPHVEAYTALFRQWLQKGIQFYAFHISDEHLNDSLEFYSLENCLGIVRMYSRTLPSGTDSKVLTIPLGYHWTIHGGSEDPLHKTPRLPFRSNKWSFYGTDWRGRRSLLEPLNRIEPHNSLYVDSWESEEKLGKDVYISSLLDTLFVPCPPGNNRETFRLYEALDCGCIPLYVKSSHDEAYAEMLQREIGLLSVGNWNEASVLVDHLLKETQVLENYRNSLLTRWKQWKQKLSQQVQERWGY